MRKLILLLGGVVLAETVIADEVFLKGGGQLSGRIVSRSATTIEVDVGAGKIGVPASSVVRIEEGRSALQEFEERAGRMRAGDVEGWLALGEWAAARGLSTQAREAYNRVLAVSPGEPRANAALGNVNVDGCWMSEQEITAVIDKLLAMSYDDRVASPCIGAERADLVLAGCAILEAIRRAFPCPRLRVADRGLREGMLVQMMRADGVWGGGGGGGGGGEARAP